MRGLTLYQPHATLVSLADRNRYPNQGDLCKRIETRARRISYRGLLAIHAAASFPAHYRDLNMNLAVPAITQALHRAGYFYTALMFAMSPRHEVLPQGKIVAVCRLVYCIEITAENAPPEPERSFGDYTPGRWAWHLENITALPKPIPCRGMQGLWRVPADVVARMAEMGVAASG